MARVTWRSGLRVGSLGARGERPRTFDVEPSRRGLRTVGSGLTGLDHFAQYGISIEPGQEAPSEPTDIVAMG